MHILLRYNPHIFLINKISIFCLLLVFIGSCRSFDDLPKYNTSISSNHTSPERQHIYALGKLEHPRILALYGGIYKNKRLENLLAGILGKLINVNRKKNTHFQLHILDSPQINAFALPGGELYVTRGLVTLASDHSEIAVVLAHEMAHIELNHAMARLKHSQTNKTAKSIVSLVQKKSNKDLLKNRPPKQTLSFSQQQELEADKKGIGLLKEAGFDPYAAGRFLRKMNLYAWLKRNQKYGAIQGGKELLTSHPAPPERLRKAIAIARKTGLPNPNIAAKKTYLKAIEGTYYGDKPKHGYIKNDTYYHTGKKIKFQFRGFGAMVKKNQLILINENAPVIRYEEVTEQANIKQSLKSYMTSGWLNGLDKQSIQFTKVNGFSAITAKAKVDQWVFYIALIRSKDTLARFIAATHEDTALALQHFTQVYKSFRRLSVREIANIKPYLIKIYKVRKGDSISQLANKLPYGDNKNSILRIINGIPKHGKLKTGDYIKVISE